MKYLIGLLTAAFVAGPALADEAKDQAIVDTLDAKVSKAPAVMTDAEMDEARGGAFGVDTSGMFRSIDMGPYSLVLDENGWHIEFN